MHKHRLVAVCTATAVLAATLTGLSFTGSPSTSDTSPAVAQPNPQSVVVESTAEEFTGKPTSEVAKLELAPTALLGGLAGPSAVTRYGEQGVRFSGSIATASTSSRTVLLEELVNGVWSTVASKLYSPEAFGNVNISLAGVLPGNHVYRINVPATADAAEAVGVAQTVDMKARPLSFSVNSVITRLSQLSSQDGVSVFVSSQVMEPADSFVLERFNKSSNSWIAVDTKPYSNGQVNLRDARQIAEKDSVRYRVRSLVADPLYTGIVSPEYTVSYKKMTTVLQSTTAPLGKTVSTAAATSLTYTGRFQDTATPRTVQLQSYNTTKKTWSTVTSVVSSQGSWKLVLGPNEAANTTYRIFVPEIADATQVVTGNFIVKRTMQSVIVSNGGGKDKVMPWESNTVLWTVNDDKGTKVQVQQLVGKTWKKIADRTIDSRRQVGYAMPKGNTKSASQKFRYRVLIPKHKIGYKETAAGDRTVVWENPNRYTGVSKKVYDYMKGKCPAIFISVNNKLPKNVWALSYLGENRTEVYGAIPDKYLRTVALHECGHHYQHKFYGASINTWNTFLGRMNKVYGQKGNLGMEQNADCIANAWAKNSYYAYKGNCNGERGVAGKTIASNKKY